MFTSLLVLSLLVSAQLPDECCVCNKHTTYDLVVRCHECGRLESGISYESLMAKLKQKQTVVRKDTIQDMLFPHEHEWVTGPFYVTVANSYEEPRYYPPAAMMKFEFCRWCGIMRIPDDLRAYTGPNIAAGKDTSRYEPKARRIPTQADSAKSMLCSDSLLFCDYALVRADTTYYFRYWMNTRMVDFLRTDPWNAKTARLVIPLDTFVVRYLDRAKPDGVR